MNRILASILGLVGLLTAPAAFAQSTTHTPFQQPQYFAVDYGQWAIKSQSPNLFQFSPGGLCGGSASGSQFFVFATNAPVFINDATQANSEVVTPTTVTNTQSQCGFTAAPANNHTSFQVQSGTAGLQESLNALASPSTAYPAKIILDRNWYVAANSVPGTNGITILGAAKGNAHAFLEDVTTAGATEYVWNGTAYASGTWVNVKPTAAAGAGAGTGPTIADSGTALATTVSLTTGTATATGALFTVTWGSGHGFTYAPTGCTVTSTGPNNFTAFTTAVSGTTTPVLTVTATAAPAVSTAYAFTITGCK